ncbi:MAG TPA: copper transporter [Limnochordia bacterium]|nr:copper transporter [Limnochordia bacterium]
MFDYKYHVISLVAVFLALGIGILVGSTMLGGDVLVEQQKLMVDRLEEDFRNFREQNRLLQEELLSYRSLAESYRAFAQQVLPALVTGRLAGVKLALFNLDGAQLPQGLIDTLALAGAEIAYYTQVVSAQHLELINTSINSHLAKLDAAIILGSPRQNSPDRHLLGRKLLEILTAAHEEITIVAAVNDSGQLAGWANFVQEQLAGTVENIESVMDQTSLVFSLSQHLENGNWLLTVDAR